MNNKNIIALFEDTAPAELAVKDLRAAGVSDADISYIYASEGRMVTEGGGETVGEGAASGAGTGALLGGLAGLAVANGILPGLGSLFVAGPLATALGLTGAAATTAAGAMTGAAAGGLVGALTGWGVGEEEAKIYEAKVNAGSVMVSAQTDRVDKVKEILRNHGADEIKEF